MYPGPVDDIQLPDPYARPLVTLAEVAECWGVHRATAWRWVHADGCRILPGGRIPTAVMYAWLGQPFPAPAPPPPRVITLNPPE